MSDSIEASPGADPNDDREVGGVFHGQYGPQTERKESGLTALKEERMLNRAIRMGWIKGGRWPTEATPSELKARQQERGELTLKEQLATAIFLDASLAITEKDPALRVAQQKLRQMAVRNGIAMERQNQVDEVTDIKAGLAREASRSMSSATLDAIVAQCAQVVADVVGSDKASEVLAELSDRIRVDAGTQGTMITPDMEAMAMDATVPDGPDEDDQDQDDDEGD